jgi:hypothetical protein
MLYELSIEYNYAPQYYDGAQRYIKFYFDNYDQLANIDDALDSYFKKNSVAKFNAATYTYAIPLDKFDCLLNVFSQSVLQNRMFNNYVYVKINIAINDMYSGELDELLKNELKELTIKEIIE